MGINFEVTTIVRRDMEKREKGEQDGSRPTSPR